MPPFIFHRPSQGQHKETIMFDTSHRASVRHLANIVATAAAFSTVFVILFATAIR